LPLGTDALIGWERRKLRWFVGLALVFSPGLALALTPFGGTTALAGWVLGGSFGLGLAGLVLAQWWQIRRVRRRLSAFCRGEYLVHWTYTPDEWGVFAAERGLADRTAGEAFVGRRAGYCGGDFAEWQVLGADLERVVVHERDDGTPARLEFVIHLYGPQWGQDWRRSFWVPVPAGKGSEARDLLAHLCG
jgi:hypothetical protein